MENLSDRWVAGGKVFLSTLFYSIYPCICFCASTSFDYCSFVVFSEIWEDYASSFVLFPLDCFSNSGSFMVPHKFQDYLFYVKNALGILIGIPLKL